MTERMGYWVDCRRPVPDDGPGVRPERLVVAQAGLRQGPARGGLPGRAVLPALRHRPVRPRARPGLRDRRRPVGLRALPAHQRPVRRDGRAAGLDHDAVDARVQHRRRRPPGRHLRHGRNERRGDPRRRRAAGRAGPRRRAGRCSDRFAGTEMERWTYERPFDLRRLAGGRATATSCVLADYVTTEDGTGLVHQSPAFGAEDLAVSRAYGLPVVNPVRPDGHFEESVRLVGGEFFKHADKALVQRPRGARHALPAPGLRARLPALLALPHRAALLRAALLVRPHDAGQGRPARRERAHQLVPGEHQVGPLRRLAAQQHRLGAVPHAATGAPPCPIWRCADDGSHLVCVGSLAELGELAGQDLADPRPAPAVRRRRDAALHPVCGRRRCDTDAPGAGGDRRLVRLRLDAVRPVGLPARATARSRSSRARSLRSSSARRSTRPAAGSTR